jgi:multiple sugar transport system substrate-binding protein
MTALSRNNKYRRYINHVFVLLFTVSAFTGCDESSESSSNTWNEDAKVLTYWSAPNPQEFELAKIIVKEWNDNHDDVKIKLQALPAGQSSEEVLLSAMVAGTTPDICSNIWPGITNDFIRANALIALDSFEDFNEVISERVPADVIQSAVAADGSIYQIPWKTNPIMVQYNVKMFKEADVDSFPRTYSAFIEAAAKITKDRDGDGNIDQWMGYRDIRPIWWQR